MDYRQLCCSNSLYQNSAEDIINDIVESGHWTLF